MPYWNAKHGAALLLTVFLLSSCAPIGIVTPDGITISHPWYSSVPWLLGFIASIATFRWGLVNVVASALGLKILRMAALYLGWISLVFGLYCMVQAGAYVFTKVYVTSSGLEMKRFVRAPRVYPWNQVTGIFGFDGEQDFFLSFKGDSREFWFTEASFGKEGLQNAYNYVHPMMVNGQEEAARQEAVVNQRKRGFKAGEGSKRASDLLEERRQKVNESEAGPR